jgi:hypothetical protein
MMIKRHDVGNMNAFWTRSLADVVIEGLSMFVDFEKVNCPFTINRSD